MSKWAEKVRDAHNDMVAKVEGLRSLKLNYQYPRPSQWIAVMNARISMSAMWLILLSEAEQERSRAGDRREARKWDRVDKAIWVAARHKHRAWARADREKLWGA